MATLHSIKKMQRNNKRINFLLHGTAAWEVKINLKICTIWELID